MLRERRLGVFGIGVGLLFLLSALASLASPRMSELDAAAVLAERFGSYEAPHGLPLLGAFRLPRGEEVLRYGRAAELEAEQAAFDEARRSAPKRPDTGKRWRWGGDRSSRRGRHGRGEGGGENDWARVEVGEPSAGPYEAVLVWALPKASEKFLEREFGRIQFSEINELDWEGGPVVIDSRVVPWDQYETRVVRTRNFERFGAKASFQDRARVNMTIGNRACALYLRWPREVPSTIEQVEAAIAGITPRASR